MRIAIPLAAFLVAALPAAAQPPPKPKSKVEAEAPAGKTELIWFGHAAFEIRTPGGKVLLVDPWLQNPKNPNGKQMVDKPGQVDAILVSHAHGDHVGDAVALGKKTKAALVSTFDLGRVLMAAGYPKEGVGYATQGNTGGTVTLFDGEVTVTFVPAVHGSSFDVPKGKGFAAISDAGNAGGFVIRVRNGPAIYHTGDTDVFSDMARVTTEGPITVMLACIGGHFTMGPERAAEAVMLVNPKVVVPMHFGTMPILAGTPDALRAALKKAGSKAEVQDLEVGKAVSF